MVFSPKTSIVRRINSYKVPTWMTRMDLVDDNWGSLVQTLAGHYLCPVETVAFSSDNKHIVSCSRDDIKLWDVVTGNLKRTLRASSSIHQAAALSPDGKIILAGCLNGNIHLWDTLTGNLQKTLSCCPWIRAVGFSPNGRHIAFGSIDGTIHLCDTITWDQKTIDTITWDRKMMESRSPWVNTFTFSPDGKYIVSGSDDGAITLWNAMTGNAEKPLAGHSRSIRAVAFSPDGRSIISGSGDGIIKLWDVITGDVQRTVVFPLQGQGKYSSEVSPIALSPDGQYMASVSIDGKLKLWDTMTGNVHRILSHNSQGGLTSIAFSTDGKYIVSGSGDGTISLWDTTKQDLEIIPVRHTAPVSSVAFSQDGKYIVSSSYDGTIKIWDTTTGNLQRTLVGHAQNGYLLGIDVAAFSPDGRDIISAFSDGTMKLFDTVTGKLQKRLVDDVKVSAVAVSPDKRYILCGSRIGTIKLWDAVTGDLQKILRGHSESVRTMAFSPDGKYIASSYSDRTVRIWDVQKCIKTSKWLGNTLGRVLKSWLWREIRTTAVVRTLRFSPDGISLETNIGPIRLSGSLTDGESCPKGSLEYLWVQNQWIYYGLSCPILQLPAYLRPTCYTVRGDQITIGCGDGQVLNFAIDRRRLHSLLEDRTQQQSRPLLT
jgi:WD40 repeat protein